VKALNFDALSPYKTDPILGLAERVKLDSRSDVLDCSIGLLVSSAQDSSKKVWIPNVVKKFFDVSVVDAYEPIAGNKEFLESTQKFLGLRTNLVFQTLGSSQACRISFEVLKTLGVTEVITTVPTWPNHIQMLNQLELSIIQVNHTTPSGELDFDAVFRAIQQRASHEYVAVLIHGSCHNPTGVDFSKAQLTEILKENSVIPVIDFSYHGFGDEDLEAYVLEIFNQTPIGFLCYSFSKTAGLYNQRLGCLFVKCPDGKVDLFKGQITKLIRTHNSTPCGTGARIMAGILKSKNNLIEWRNEVEQTKEHLSTLRHSLASELPQEISNLVSKQKGLFAFIPRTFLKDSPSEVQERLIQNDALYSVALEEGLRLNIAGLQSQNSALKAGRILRSYLLI